MASIGSQFMCQDFAECIASVAGRGGRRATATPGSSTRQILWQDFVVYMTSALAATERIVVGTAVTNPFTRHVTTTASTFATLAQLHPGRLELGIGRGDSAVRTMGLEPVQDVVPARLDPRAPRSRRRPPRGAERRRRPPPLGRGGSEGADHDVRDRAARTSGSPASLADRVMLYVGVNQTSVRWAMEHVRAGAEEAGRDPDSRDRFSLLTAMWVGDDQEEAWDKCRWAPAACANHIADTMRRNPEHDMPVEMTRLPESRDEYDYYAGPPLLRRRAHRVPDRRADRRLRARGQRREGAREGAGASHELGIDEISCAYLNGEKEQMALVGREVIGWPPAPARSERDETRSASTSAARSPTSSSSTRSPAGSRSTRFPRRRTTPPAAPSTGIARALRQGRRRARRDRQPPPRHDGRDEHRARRTRARRSG